MFDVQTVFGLKGQRALVTGGAGGIGQAIAVALAAAGADVAITWNREPADETLSRIAAAGARGHAVQCDLATLDAASANVFVETLAADFGPIDSLVNNAGIIRRANALEHEEADWRAVMSTNLDAVWFLSQAAARPMVARGHGRIVTVASLLSYQGGIRVPGYTASKHAVAGLVKAMANELAAKGVSVNGIAPGYISTNNTKALREDPDRSRQILERIPAGRWGQPDDIAAAAVFLASKAAEYVHGHIMVVDGGWMGR